MPFTGSITPPPTKVPSSTVAHQPAVLAEFVIAPGARPDASRWEGTMTIVGLPNGATVTYCGKRLPAADPFAMVLDPLVGLVMSGTEP